MVDYTTNYGLTVPADVDEIDTNYFNDRHTIDQGIYLGAEAHRHLGPVTGTTPPAVGATLTLNNTGGTIPGGTRVYYRYTYIDLNGDETTSSPETFVDTGAAVSSPAAPTAVSFDTGGVLEPGDYYYVLSAYQTSTTIETLATFPVMITVPAGTSTNRIVLTLPALPSGATGFNIYRRRPGYTHYYYLDSVNMNVATPPSTYEDDGSVAENCDRGLPAANNTNQSFSVTIDIPAPPVGYTWKLYRTYDNTNWGNSYLALIDTMTGATPQVITTYTDIGTATTAGNPPYVFAGFSNPSKVILTDGTEVQGVLAPANQVIHHTVEFAFNGILSPFTGTFQWRCHFEAAVIREVRITLGYGSSPAAQSVIVDVNKVDNQVVSPTPTTIFTTQANRPTIPVGENYSTAAVPDVTSLFENDCLTVDIDQEGGGATPTDQDLLIQIVVFGFMPSITVTPTMPV